jgi:hypothetical protein
MTPLTPTAPVIQAPPVLVALATGPAESPALDPEPSPAPYAPMPLDELRTAWRARPKDTTHHDLRGLIAACEAHEHRCAPRHKGVHELKVNADSVGIYVEARGPVFLTHQAFRQLCGILKAPGAHLQDRTPDLVRRYLTEMIGDFAGRAQHNLLSCKEGDHWLVECVTGTAYGRIWNSSVARAVQAVNADGRWVPNGPEALARSRHGIDLAFVDPSTEIALGDGTVMRPAFSAFNSIAGDRSFGLEARAYLPSEDVRLPVSSDVAGILFRHSKHALERFRREAVATLEAFVATDWSRTTDEYEAAKRHTLGDDAAAAKRLRNLGLTQPQRKEILLSLPENGLSRWDLAVAVARYARDHAGYPEERLRIEGAAAALLRS